MMNLNVEDVFEIEDLGIQEEWVYDIEVQNNHNFFGNNILIHNSDYFHIEPFVNLYLQKNPESTIDETVTWCDEFEKKVIQPVISQTVSDFCDELNAYNREKIGADREIIADCLTGSNVIKVKIDGKNITMPIGTLAKNNGLNQNTKSNAIADLSAKNIQILSYNSLTNKNELKRILNIQRKVTTKKILTLQAPNGRKIHVTEDHLIAIRENDVIIYKEAKRITEDDDVALFDHMMYKELYMCGVKIIEKKYSTETKIVYDIEVEDNHNFYADQFLVHNCTIFSAKKKYIARVRDSEGTRYPENDPYMKVMGMEIAKSSTPVWAKKKLKESLSVILDNEYHDLMNWVADIKSDFTKTDLNNIAQVGTANNLNYNLKTDKGIPIGSRAALCYNEYIKEKAIDDKYNAILPGDKNKKLFLVQPNPLKSNIVSYATDNFIDEIRDYIDYDANFEKGFLNALQLMVDSLGWDLSKKTESLDEW